jgi:hypothetical protein
MKGRRLEAYISCGVTAWSQQRKEYKRHSRLRGTIGRTATIGTYCRRNNERNNARSTTKRREKTVKTKSQMRNNECVMSERFARGDDEMKREIHGWRAHYHRKSPGREPAPGPGWQSQSSMAENRSDTLIRPASQMQRLEALAQGGDAVEAVVRWML